VAARSSLFSSAVGCDARNSLPSELKIWHVVKAAAHRAGILNLAPHDLRRTCARLCHLAGGDLKQIQFLLGHVSVQTTERSILAASKSCVMP
jgi:integrase